ncbi:kinase-like domain-containing protein [Lasiosphaeria ovina]|uniref:Kinase-like domain-containing protein n=1 Tax=Lasiosphaeria ovina TaxID=92902 RepID=A0AAE0K444_9PEZI|nr:kinase-like domain-containing protein [Lasiosphaeria ovina]
MEVLVVRYFCRRQPWHDNCDCKGYCLVEVIDSGSYGTVSRVYHEDKPEQYYARKQIRLDKSALNTIRNEVDLIRRASHSNMIQVIDDYHDKDWHYIVMSPLADQNLENSLQEMPKSPVDSAAWSTVAVRRIHKQDIRHRDIKPANILIHGKHICLADFGTSFHSEASTVRTHTSTRGTNKYEAKETQDGSRGGRGADIFSLGATFFEMAEALSRPVLVTQFPCITKPYFAHADNHGFLQSIRKVKERPKHRSRLPERFRFNEGFLQPLLDLICSMLSSDPIYRPTADEVVRSLESILKEAGCKRLSCCVGE